MKSIRALLNGETIRESLLSFLLLVIMFAPALTIDAPTQDQLRAFQYGLNVKADWELCRAGTRDFYLQTGRPLVPLTECVEHVYSWKIKHLTYARWVSVFVMSLFLLLLLQTFNGLTRHFEWSLLNALVVVGIPGLQVFILQGGPAVVLLLGLPLVWLGMNSFLRVLQTQVGGPLARVKSFWRPTLFLFPVFFIYPALVFIGYWQLAFRGLYSSGEREFKAVIRQAAWYTGYICALGLSYFVISKAVIEVVYEPWRLIPLGDNYSLSPDPIGAIGKIPRIFHVWWNHAFFLWDQTHELPLHLLSIAALVGAFWLMAGEFRERKSFLLAKKAAFAFVMIVFAQAIWLVSRNALEPSRYFIHVFAIHSVLVLWVIWLMLQKTDEKWRLWWSRVFLLLVIFTVERSVSREMANTLVETSVVRSGLYSHYQARGIDAFKHIHLVKPEPDESYVGTGCMNNESLCSPLSQNSEHSGQLIRALLREFLAPAEIQTYKVVNCRERLNCIRTNLGRPNTIVTSTALKEKTGYVDSATVVLDMNKLVSKGHVGQKYKMP